MKTKSRKHTTSLNFCFASKIGRRLRIQQDSKYRVRAVGGQGTVVMVGINLSAGCGVDGRGTFIVIRCNEINGFHRDSAKDGRAKYFKQDDNAFLKTFLLLLLQMCIRDSITTP